MKKCKGLFKIWLFEILIWIFWLTDLFFSLESLFLPLQTFFPEVPIVWKIKKSMVLLDWKSVHKDFFIDKSRMWHLCLRYMVYNCLIFKIGLTVLKEKKSYEKLNTPFWNSRGGISTQFLLFKIIYFTKTIIRNSSFSPFCSKMLQNELIAYWRFKVVHPIPH